MDRVTFIDLDGQHQSIQTSFSSLFSCSALLWQVRKRMTLIGFLGLALVIMSYIVMAQFTGTPKQLHSGAQDDSSTKLMKALFYLLIPPTVLDSCSQIL